MHYIYKACEANYTSLGAGNSFLVPGATAATILMLGALHARRLYDDKKVRICSLYMCIHYKHQLPSLEVLI